MSYEGETMFMSCIGAFSSIVGRKEAKYVIWEFTCELCINDEFYKGTIKSYELVGI